MNKDIFNKVEEFAHELNYIVPTIRFAVFYAKRSGHIVKAELKTQHTTAVIEIPLSDIEACDDLEKLAESTARRLEVMAKEV